MGKKSGKKDKKEKKKKGKEVDAIKLLTGPENQARENYRELLLARVSEKQLQERIERVSTDYKNYKDQNEEVNKNQNQDLQTQYQEIQDTLQKLSKEKHEKEFCLETIEQKNQEIKSLVQQFEDEKEQIFKEHQDEINRHSDKFFKLEQKYIELSQYEKEKEKQKLEIETLRAKIDQLQGDHVEELASLERDKIQSNDNLKKQMLAKIKQTKTKLMALNDQQLHTTTKLTVLENHRLTQELEYQSKQTEILLHRQTQLQDQVQGLKRDIEVHKQVECELAKRSHHYQKVIKKLQQKLKSIEENHNIQISHQTSIDHSHDQMTSRSIDIVAMEQKMLALESQVKIIQEECNQANKEKNMYKSKIEEYTKPLTDLNSIMRNYLLNFQSIAQQDLSSEDIQRIMDTPQEEWDQNDKITVIEVLLKYIEPYLFPNFTIQQKNLKIDQPKTDSNHYIKSQSAKHGRTLHYSTKTETPRSIQSVRESNDLQRKLHTKLPKIV